MTGGKLGSRSGNRALLARMSCLPQRTALRSVSAIRSAVTPRPEQQADVRRIEGRRVDAHDNFIVLGFGHFHSRERYPELAVLVIKDCSCSLVSATFVFM